MSLMSRFNQELDAFVGRFVHYLSNEPWRSEHPELSDERWPRAKRDEDETAKAQPARKAKAKRETTPKPKAASKPKKTTKPGTAPKPKTTAQAEAPATARPEPALTAEERAVLEALGEAGEKVAMKALTEKTGKSASWVRARLKDLIAKQRVRRVGEGLRTRYERIES